MTLATRAVACPGWRWLPGMLGKLPSGIRVRIAGFARDEGEEPSTYVLDMDILRDCDGTWEDDDGPNALPDLTDPATLGCVLSLVREAWGDPSAHCYSTGQGSGLWNVEVRDISIGCGDSEAEALVAALETAP